MANRNLWNYQIAEKLVKQFSKAQEIVFESGFGPSGYPHIGTYGEILRPHFVIRALKDISDKRTKYIVFCDDMDGLRKVPQGMPDSLRQFLGVPVCKIPDPWGTCSSFSEHIIDRVKSWLRELGLGYDVFKYSHEAYESGEFNDALKILLKNHEKVSSIILPTLREESREGWSPFMPLCEKCGKNLTTRVTDYRVESDSIRYACDKDAEAAKACGYAGETSILNGKVKVGWKVDWALRWFVYGVNFEMYGKDLIDSAALSGQIVKTVFGGRPPLGYFYEMFLDETGAKISKSVGKGLTVENWFSMAPKESLNLLLFKHPQKAKELTFNVIPRYADEYLELMSQHYAKLPEERLDEGRYRDAFDFVTGSVPEKSPYAYRVNYALLANLIAAVGKTDAQIIKAFVCKYEDEKPESNPYLERMIEKAGEYVKNVMEKDKTPYQPSAEIRQCVSSLQSYLEAANHTEEELQNKIFATAKEHNIRADEFFKAIYRLLLGQASGPRLGSFIHLLGEKEVADRLRAALLQT